MLELNDTRHPPRISPDIRLTDFKTDNGRSVGGSDSPDKNFKIGRVPRLASIVIIDSNLHGRTDIMSSE